jgi:dipeptidase
MKFYRETYEGTDFDMTKNLMVERRPDRRRDQSQQTQEAQPQKIKSPIANPWMSRDMMNLLNTIKPGTVERRRIIAIAGCSYSQIIQLRDWLPDEIGGVAWFSFDNPALSPRIPIFSGITELPKSFAIGAQKRYRTDSACWSFRRANRLATVRWGKAKEYIEKAVMDFENRAFDELPAIEEKARQLYNSEMADSDDPKAPLKCKEFLTNYTNHFAHSAMSKWQELGDLFWHFFGRGF